MSFSSFFYKYTICQRSFRSFLKYRTIVLHFLFPSLVHHSPVHSIVHSFNRSFVQSFIVFIPSSLSGTTIIYCLYYYSFSIHFRDHLAIILNVTVGFLSLLYLFPFLQPVPFLLYLFLFGLSLYKFACLFLCFLVYFLYKLVSFLSSLYLFYP